MTRRIGDNELALRCCKIAVSYIDRDALLPLCAEAGADVLVSGSAVFGAPDLAERIASFRAAAEAAAATSA